MASPILVYVALDNSVDEALAGIATDHDDTPA
jgi:hypothetical protein